MLTSIFVQTQTPSTNIIDAILNGVSQNPSLVTLAVALIVIYFATRGIRDELRESRKMINNSQAASDAQENKALDMAMKAIDKMDRVAESLDNFADAQRSSSKDYFAAAEKIANAHVETTTLLVNRIATMEDRRAEDEIYSDEALKRQIDEQLNLHKEDVGRLVGTILAEAKTLHQETRRTFSVNNELVLTALQAVPPPVGPVKELGPDTHGG